MRCSSQHKMEVESCALPKIFSCETR